MQGGAQRSDIPKFRIAEDRRDREARRAHLPQQRQRLAPLFLKDDAGWNARARPLLRRQPLLGQIQLRPETPAADAGPQRHGRRDLAIRDLAKRATVLTDRADRVGTLFRKTRAVENQDTAPFWNHRAQSTPDLRRVPGRVRNEMLEGLIGDGLGHSRQHRLHRLPLAVAEDALDVGPQRHQLRPMPETALEALEPAHKALDARRRCMVDHRAAPYQTTVKSTMSSI